MPINYLKRWANNVDSLTLDLGDYEDDYVILDTKEGDSISSLISGYIDIVLKKRRGIDCVFMTSRRC